METMKHNFREQGVNENAQPASMPGKQRAKPKRSYEKHGDYRRVEELKDIGLDAIDGRTKAGKPAKQWLLLALNKKGGRDCSIDVRRKIVSATFLLWRALKLLEYIQEDFKKRGTLFDRRSKTLLPINKDHDEMMERWKRINDELGLNEGELDLARRLMLKGQGK
jgi:hypothetical protein